MKFLKYAAFGAAFVLSSNVFAATTTTETFSFTGGLSPDTVTKSFTSDHGSDLTVTSFSERGSNRFHGNVSQNGNGLGVDYHDGLFCFFFCVPTEGRDASALDDIVGKDYLVLDFGNPVWRPVSLTFSEFTPFFDYEIYATNSLDTSGTTGFFDSISGLNPIFDSTVDAGGEFAANPFFFDPFEAPVAYIIISASSTEEFITGFFGGTLPALDNQDAFRVAGFQGVQVPVPAALPLLATAMGGLGIASWWRRRKATV